MNREKRWLILCEDGRHVWVGRDSDPTEGEILAAEAGLSSQGLAGWLAVSEGRYWQSEVLRLLMVRPLGEPTISFEVAVAAFQQTRRDRLE